jgi:hypothetical protein
MDVVGIELMGAAIRRIEGTERAMIIGRLNGTFFHFFLMRLVRIVA